MHCSRQFWPIVAQEALWRVADSQIGCPNTILSHPTLLSSSPQSLFFTPSHSLRLYLSLTPLTRYLSQSLSPRLSLSLLLNFSVTMRDELRIKATFNATQYEAAALTVSQSWNLLTHRSISFSNVQFDILEKKSRAHFLPCDTTV